MTAWNRLPLVAILAVAAILAAQAGADDGGSGTYTIAASSYEVMLLNSGTTAWQFFTLTAPAGTAFVGGATQGESTARCTAGAPDGLPNELECGPVSVGPGARVGVAATVAGSASCGAAFHLAVSSTGSSFSQASDIAPSASCSATTAPARPNNCSAAIAEAAAAATVAELGAEEQALSSDWSSALKLLAQAQRTLAARPHSPAVTAALGAIASARSAAARLQALALAVGGRRTTAATTLAAEQAASSCQASTSNRCASLTAAARSRLGVFNGAAGDIGGTKVATASARLAGTTAPLGAAAPSTLTHAASDLRAGASRLARFLGKRPASTHC